jgi:hypothetical protein
MPGLGVYSPFRFSGAGTAPAAFLCACVPEEEGSAARRQHSRHLLINLFNGWPERDAGLLIARESGRAKAVSLVLRPLLSVSENDVSSAISLSDPPERLMCHYLHPWKQNIVNLIL